MAARKTKSKKSAGKISPEDFFASIKPVPEYIKHVVECRCHLPQYEKMDVIPSHKFIVFSELDESANIKQSYAQCNNCEIIHRVTDVGVSETIKKESMRSLETINDIEDQLPDWLSKLLTANECELHTWQEARFIFHNQLWGKFIVLSKEREDNLVIAKICQIYGDNLYKIETIESSETF